MKYKEIIALSLNEDAQLQVEKSLKNPHKVITLDHVKFWSGDPRRDKNLKRWNITFKQSEDEKKADRWASLTGTKNNLFWYLIQGIRIAPNPEKLKKKFPEIFK